MKAILLTLLAACATASSARLEPGFGVPQMQKSLDGRLGDQARPETRRRVLDAVAQRGFNALLDEVIQ